jgi:hypothetical protein
MSAEHRDAPDRQVGGGAGFPRLADELMALFARGVDAPLDESTFNALALRAFTHQMDSNATYRAFCEARDVRPAGIGRWEDVPAVPTTAFKRLDLVSSDGRPVEAVFRTSGTTGGYGARGRHLVPSLALYRASLLPNFRAALLPGGERLPLLSLVPSPAEAPDSSLSSMVGTAGHELCDGVRWLVDGDGRLDLAGFVESAAALEAEGRPALLTGTAYAFVHLLDGLTLRGEKAPLPEGTRIMETGGFKGRSRVLGRDALYRAVEELLGVPTHRVVNEYGMTELLSQLYEPVLREGPSAERRHVPPPWLRARALDPGTLEPLPPGEVGLLAFFDLANLGSVCHVLTEDLGSVAPDGMRLQGRVEGAEPRGCSRAMEELMTASGRRS